MNLHNYMINRSLRSLRRLLMHKRLKRNKVKSDYWKNSSNQSLKNSMKILNFLRRMKAVQRANRTSTNLFEPLRLTRNFIVAQRLNPALHNLKKKRVKLMIACRRSEVSLQESRISTSRELHTRTPQKVSLRKERKSQKTLKNSKMIYLNWNSQYGGPG